MMIESNSEQNPDNLKGFESLLRDFESLVKAEKLFVQELSCIMGTLILRSDRIYQ